MFYSTYVHNILAKAHRLSHWKLKIQNFSPLGEQRLDVKQPITARHWNSSPLIGTGSIPSFFALSQWSPKVQNIQKARDLWTGLSLALKQNLRSKAFKYYESTFSDDDVTVVNTHSLKHTILPEDIQALVVEWNSSGTTVAAACGWSQHEDWCTHRGYVCTWNIERRSLDPAEAG